MSDAIAERATVLCNGVFEHAERDSDAGDAVAIDYAKRLVVVVRELLAERDKDGEALMIAKAALDAADVKMREIAAERDRAMDALALAAQSFEYAVAENNKATTRFIVKCELELSETKKERDEARARCATAQSELLPTIDGLTSINTQLGRELDAMTKARDALGEYTYASSAAEEVRIAALRAVGAK